MNSNLSAYPYNRTLGLQVLYGDSPTPQDGQALALILRAYNGQPVTLDATGCALSDAFIQATVMGENWVRSTTPRTTRYASHVRWVGITQANRRALEQTVFEFPRQAN